MKRCLLILLSGCLVATKVSAFDWTASNIQLLYGNDFKFGDKQRTTLTVEHANGWQYVKNFFFVDLVDRKDIGFEIYAEVYSYLSLKKISSNAWNFGPINDISLLAGLNISNKPEQNNFKAYLLGISFDIENPYFNYLQLDVATYKNDSLSGRYGIQVTPVWSLPFELGPGKFKFRGFVDFRSGNTNASGNFHMLAQPQLLFDIGDVMNWKSDLVYIGTEYSYWHNKFGVKDMHESVFQGMIITFF